VARIVGRSRVVIMSATASTLAVVAAVAGVLVATAGGSSSVALTTKPTPPASAAADPVALTEAVACPQRPAPVAPQQLAAFHAVTLVSCIQDSRELPGRGEWLVDVRRVATGGVDAVAAALAAPGERRTTGGCTLQLTWVDPVVLVDAAGRTLTPTAPKDRCGHPQQQLLVALQAVPWREVSVRPMRQLVTPEAEAAGCPQQYKNMTYVEARGASLSSGGPLFIRAPRTVRVCIYATTANDFEVGSFQRVVQLSADDTATLLDALSKPGRAGSCRTQQEFAAVLSNDWTTVELGGCWRVARSEPHAGIGSADATVVARLLGG
jgi:hypothetical protein